MSTPAALRKHTLASKKHAALARFDTTPQGTSGWWKRRSNKFSGSKIANICFLKTQDERQTYWQEVFGLRPRPPLDEEALARCKYGKDHEDDGVHNLLHHVPSMQMWEVGFEMHEQHPDWFGSSPDGVIFDPTLEPQWGALEIKCSTKKNDKGVSVPHAGIPYYYMGQMFAEMKCMPLPQQAKWNIFVSWSESKCKCYRVDWDDTYWNLLWDVIVDFTCNESSWDAFKVKRDAMVEASKEMCARATPYHPKGGFITVPRDHE